VIRWITTHEIKINIRVNLISEHADRPGPWAGPSAHFGVQQRRNYSVLKLCILTSDHRLLSNSSAGNCWVGCRLVCVLLGAGCCSAMSVGQHVNQMRICRMLPPRDGGCGVGAPKVESLHAAKPALPAWSPWTPRPRHYFGQSR
jgi:hypothetical protein